MANDETLQPDGSDFDLQQSENHNNDLDKDSIPALSSLGGGTEANFDPTSLPLRSQVGPYKILQKIAEGGMGAVYMAEQEAPIRRRVALKVIKFGKDSDQIIARFEAERQALAMMNHPNIAKVVDAGQTEDGLPYFAMELVKGIPLTDYCDQNKLSIPERLELFIPVCQAVQHAHQKGIIHRDLKPSNVLVAVYDGEAVPKVIDFGLAKATELQTRLTERTMYTEYGQIVGTLQYMSPEQAEMNQLDVDTRTDIYSLGVMLYELLIGSTPLDRDTMAKQALLQVLELIRDKEPPRPSTRLDESGDAISGVSEHRKIQPSQLQKILRGDLDWIVMKSLEKDRTRRYETAEAFANDIKRHLNHQPVVARPPSTLYQIGKFVRKNRGLVSAAVLTTALLVAGVIGTTYGFFKAEKERRIAISQRNIARDKTIEAEQATEIAVAREKETEAAKSVIEQQKLATESNLARSNYYLGIARWEANRATEAGEFLDRVPENYRDIEWHLAKRQIRGSDVVCYGHQHMVTSIQYRQDGRRIVSGGYDGSVRTWDPMTGKQVQLFAGHQRPVTDVSYSGNGKWIASASHDGTVKIWSSRSGALEKTLTGHEGSVLCVAFSPDGERIASSGVDQIIRIWNRESGEQIKELVGHNKQVWALDFNSHGTQLVSGSGNPYSVDNSGFARIWDIETGEQLRQLNETLEPILSVEFSPDDSKIVTAGGDPYTANKQGEIKLWNAQSGEFLTSFKGHTSWVSSAAFSPDGSQILSGSWDRTVKLWDIRTERLLRTFHGISSRVHSVGFSPDGSRVVSGCGDGSPHTLSSFVQIWDAKTGDEAYTIPRHNGVAHSLDFHPSKSRLLAGSGADAFVWDTNNWERVQTLSDHNDLIQCVSYSPNGSKIATGSRDFSIKIWDALSGKVLRTLKGHKFPVLCLAFSPDGSKLVTGSGEYPNPATIKLWDVNSGDLIYSLDAHPSNVNGIAFRPDGKRFASASEDRTVKVWETESGKQLQTLQGHSGFVHCVAYSRDGKTIASGGNGLINLWGGESGRLIRSLRGHTHYVTTVAFSPDPQGRRLLSGSYDRTVKLWDTNSAEELRSMEPHSLLVYNVGFSPDGSKIASSSKDGTVRVWNTRNHDEARVLAGLQQDVQEVLFNETGSLVLGKNETEQILWDAETGQPLPLDHWEGVESKKTHPRWLAFKRGNQIILVDQDFKNGLNETAYRSTKNRTSIMWHREKAMASTENKNWFSAVFHHAWLMKVTPNDPENLKMLGEAYTKLQESLPESSKPNYSPVMMDAINRLEKE